MHGKIGAHCSNHLTFGVRFFAQSDKPVRGLYHSRAVAIGSEFIPDVHKQVMATVAELFHKLSTEGVALLRANAFHDFTNRVRSSFALEIISHTGFDLLTVEENRNPSALLASGFLPRSDGVQGGGADPVDRDNPCDLILVTGVL